MAFTDGGSFVWHDHIDRIIFSGNVEKHYLDTDGGSFVWHDHIDRIIFSGTVSKQYLVSASGGGGGTLKGWVLKNGQWKPIKSTTLY